MIVTIHQPDFLPWLGFFSRWEMSDLLIILDDVQFLRRGWHHRDRIKTSAGVRWLTVPVKTKGRYDQKINEVRVSDDPEWRDRHLETIKHAYGKAPNFNAVFETLSDIYSRKQEYLMDVNLALLTFGAQMLHITVPFQLASTFRIHSTKSQRLVDLVKCVGGDTYLTGQGSRAYLDDSLFEDNGIAVRWQTFEHPVYPQLHGDFEPNLSVLDYLMMVPVKDIEN
ncbi:MAG: WbqC family protein [Candidatus Omnitrophota bacterium]